MLGTIIGTALGFVMGTIITGAAMVIFWKPIMRWSMKQTQDITKEFMNDLMKEYDN